MINIDILRAYNVQISGSGSQPMLFAHGLGCNHNMWRNVIPSFEHDHKIILIDYPGSGGNMADLYNGKPHESLADYAADMIDVIETLGLNNVIFVGHSVSSMVGMLAAIQAPHLFKHLIMVGPSPCYINSAGYFGGFERSDVDVLLNRLKESLVDWSSEYGPIIMGNPNRPELKDELESSFRASNHTALYNLAQMTFLTDLRNELPRLTVPSLIMQCDEDLIAPPEAGEYMNDLIPGSKLVHMKATGHCAHMSEPDETVTLMKQYLYPN